MNKQIATFLTKLDTARTQVDEAKVKENDLNDQREELERVIRLAAIEAGAATDSEREAHINAIKASGVNLFLNPDYAPLAAKVYSYIRTVEMYNYGSRVAEAIQDVSQAVAPVKVRVDSDPKSVRVITTLSALQDPGEFTSVVDFIVSYYERYKADHENDATLTVSVFENYKGRLIGPYSVMVENINMEWRTFRSGRGIVDTPAADPQNLRATVENILKVHIA